eukprot:314377_1
MLSLHVFLFILKCIDSRIIFGDTFGKLYEPPKLDLSTIDTLHLYVAKKDITATNLGEWAINMTTRIYCYSLTNATGFNEEDCSIPGPTLIMRPNSTANIVLHNYLDGIGSLPEGLKHDTCQATGETTTWYYYKDADVTNLHVHGLHVSPYVDNVVDDFIQPFCSKQFNGNQTLIDEIGYGCFTDEYGDSKNYTFDILPIHYPGSHWYHAHIHGSVTLQVGGGLFGMINMEPREDLDTFKPQILPENDHNIVIAWVWLHDNDVCHPKLQDPYADTSCKKAPTGYPGYTFVDTSRGNPPFNFPIQSLCYINCNTLAEYIHGSQDGILSKIYNTTIKDYYSLMYNIKLNTNVFSRKEFKGWFVNAVYQPILSIQTGEWHRLRIVAANMNYLLWTVYNDNTAQKVSNDDLQIWLIANDGVYFEDGPRQLWLDPYNGTTVIPPGSRADLLIYALKKGYYNVIADNNTNQNAFFANAPVPNTIQIIMIINVTGASVPTSEANNIECTDWNSNELPCEPQSFSYSPYLKNTINETILDAKCYSKYYEGSYLSSCALQLQKEGIFKGGGGTLATGCQTSVNGIKYKMSESISTIATNTTHEWLITSNFH